MPGQSPPDVNIPIFICFVVYDGMFMSQSYDFSVPLFLCFRHFVRSFCHIPCMAVAGAYDPIRKITVCHRQNHTTLSLETSYATGNTIVCHGQYHRMLLPIPSYAIANTIVCYCQYHCMPMAVASYANRARPAVRLKNRGGCRRIHPIILSVIPLADDTAGGHSTCHSATFCTVPPTLTT